MSRRRKLLLWALLGVLACTAAGVLWLAQPRNLAPAVLGLAGQALGLELRADGVAEYRLRGTPQLVVRGLEAREPGAAQPLLKAERVLIALPWSSLRSRGRDLRLTRIELDAPVVDLAALQRWQASRPPSASPLPSLTGGLQINDGKLIGAGWELRGVHASLPSFAPDQPLRVQLRGRYLGQGLAAPADLQVFLSKPASGAALGVAGQLSLQAADWQLPMRLRLSALLHGEAGLRLERAVLGASARYISGQTELPFALGLAAPLRLDDAGLALQPAALAVRGQGPIPTLDASGALRLGEALQLQWQGQLAGWPDAWPALPPPLGQSSAPLPFALDYAGAADLSDIAALRLQREASEFDGRFRLFQVIDWIDAPAQGSPLPPIAGSLRSPRMEISGAVLEGLELQLEDPELPAAASGPAQP